jgi:long-chain acyl-CoA synthetase
MILLTGATGFLGMSVLARLAEREDAPDVVCVIRGRDRDDARSRLAAVGRTLWNRPPHGWSRVRAVPGDLTSPGLGLHAADVADLRAQPAVTVLHCAASVSFTLPVDEARRVNVGGVRHVVRVAHDLPGLERLVHVSTAYVAGHRDGAFAETDRDAGQRARNSYELTKLEAERVVAESTLPWVIARPSIVVGEAGTGWTCSFNVLYPPLRAFARGLVKPGGPPIPADPDGLLDVVPVDMVADALVALVDGAAEPGETVHLVAGEDAVRVGDFVALASRTLGLPPPVLEPGSRSGPGTVQDLTDTYLPYFDVRTRFANERSRATLHRAGVGAAPPLAEYFSQLVAFAESARWGRRPVVRQTAAWHPAAEVA